MKYKYLLLGVLLFSALSLTFSSCNKDDDEEKTEKPETPETPDTPDTPTPPTDQSVKLGYCPDTKHPHVIDLGDGMKWSCCNVGAKTPSDNGGFYAWAETEEKDNYDITTYKYSDKKSEDSCWDFDTMFAPTHGYKQPFTYSISATPYDVAYNKMGNQWRLPNMADADKLVEKCKHEVVFLNDVEGVKLTGPNGKYIFLPGGGMKVKKDWLNKWTDHPEGWYWTGTREKSVAAWDAYAFAIDKTEVYTLYSHRISGYMVRPIKSNM